jgi:large subunit ribosomal protein L15
MRTKKRKKNTRHRGSHTHSGGAKKKGRGKGHRGGIGMAGSGKRADHKKDLINHPFGKSKRIARKPASKLKIINLNQIQEKFKGQKDLDLSGYKILSEGELKEKLTIKASAISKSALDKVKKAGGNIFIEK